MDSGQRWICLRRRYSTLLWFPCCGTSKLKFLRTRLRHLSLYLWWFGSFSGAFKNIPPNYMFTILRFSIRYSKNGVTTTWRETANCFKGFINLGQQTGKEMQVIVIDWSATTLHSSHSNWTFAFTGFDWSCSSVKELHHFVRLSVWERDDI